MLLSHRHLLRALGSLLQAAVVGSFFLKGPEAEEHCTPSFPRVALHGRRSSLRNSTRISVGPQHPLQCSSPSRPGGPVTVLTPRLCPADPGLLPRKFGASSNQVGSTLLQHAPPSRGTTLPRAGLVVAPIYSAHCSRVRAYIPPFATMTTMPGLDSQATGGSPHFLFL